jgi:proteasome accessory factor B
MDRTQRLIDLLAFFLNRREPATFSDIRDEFADYREASYDAVIRKFERDKETLRELGVPLVTVEGDADGAPDSYAVDRERFFLLPIDLSREEVAVLLVAGAALLSRPEFPYRHDLELALHKLLLLRDESEVCAASALAEGVAIGQPAQKGVDAVRDRLAVIQDALVARKGIEFRYQALTTAEITDRRVDPWGLFCRRGRWSLVGWSHEREAVRVFLVHRMDKLVANTRRPKTPDFDPPADFRLSDYTAVPPWRWAMHDPIEIEIDVRNDHAWIGEQELGVLGAPAGDWTRFHVEATHADALVEWALGLGARARIAAPDEIRRRAREALLAVLGRYGET